ncbi:coiled-coil domain-containing protein 152 isoform X1 [Leopardus geoffroyi]|uniref:coiled-coil domain-containing protein 152 isoform X1 n=1 Tax=Leopardus geoffroyi TaxID=46844 RepID=UPI001E261A1D|nr:coiled-coil domain-containing protein 152 isoform X1 [Leopardus geoffroyi]
MYLKFLSPNIDKLHDRPNPQVYIRFFPPCLPSRGIRIVEKIKKMIETSGKNNILDMQLEKTNYLLKVTQTKEVSIKKECSALHNMIKGLQQTIEHQHNLKGENEQLKRNADLMREKLKSHEQEYKNNIAKLMSEMKIKEEGHKIEIRKLYQDMQEKIESNEQKHKELMEKREVEISELNAKLKTQEKEKQSEIIKLQLEFDAKLARVQTKSKSYADSTVLPQSIYRRVCEIFFHSHCVRK